VSVATIADRAAIAARAATIADRAAIAARAATIAGSPGTAVPGDRAAIAVRAAMIAARAARAAPEVRAGQPGVATIAARAAMTAVPAVAPTSHPPAGASRVSPTTRSPSCRARTTSAARDRLAGPTVVAWSGVRYTVLVSTTAKVDFEIEVPADLARLQSLKASIDACKRCSTNKMVAHHSALTGKLKRMASSIWPIC
jgi:hypothetical protein